MSQLSVECTFCKNMFFLRQKFTVISPPQENAKKIHFEITGAIS
eukprot:UN10506